ncbi:transcriptional regulator [Tenacibaculum sp. C7A-26P2]|uniref:transcriptional regulator n=1 Tax=Tenacibaculum sp. C7A-26P2 TaxID=3447504 RepID=UPI003F858103
MNLLFCLIFLSFNVLGFKGESDVNGDGVVVTYHKYIDSEDEKLLDSILTRLRSRKLTFKEDSINSKILYLRGVKNLKLLRYKKAIKYYLKAYELAENYEDCLLLGLVKNDLGVISSKMNEDATITEVYYKEAIDYFKKSDRKVQELDTYYNLTILNKKNKNCKNVLEYSELCINLIKKTKKRSDLLNTLYVIKADCYIATKDFENAKRSFISADSFIVNTGPERFLYFLKYAKFLESNREFSKANTLYKKVVSLKSEQNKENERNLKEAFERELSLENKLKKDNQIIINSQRKILYLSSVIIVVLVLSLISVFYLRKKNRERNKSIFHLNEKLKKLIANLEDKNKKLENNKNEIEQLLKLNEQALFSRILKISTYNDTLNKIIEQIDSFYDNNSFKSSFLATIRSKLISLVCEEELWKDFKVQFEKIRPSFFTKLKEIAPNLSVNDLKHCTYIVSNLKSKEVAQLINVSPRSVETARYRVKKKIGLDKEENLYDFLSNL